MTLYVPAISVWQPWAWLLVHGHDFPKGKQVENRTWPLPTRMVGQWCLIHASRRWRDEEFVRARSIAEANQVPLPYRTVFDNGGFVGAVKWGETMLVESARAAKFLCGAWAFGPFCWRTEDAEPLPFVPWKGRQGFFRVPLEELPEEYRGIGWEGLTNGTKP